MGRQYELSVLFRLIDKISDPMGRVGRTMGKLGDRVQHLRTRFAELGEAAKRAGDKMMSVGRNLSLKLSAPLMLVGGLAVRNAIKFESAFTGVINTVDATKEQFAKLKKGLMDMALKLPLSTEEIFGIAEAAGQLGIKQNDILKFTKVMADLGATTNITAREGAMQLARFATIMNMPIEQVDRLGSTIVDLGNNTATTEAEIVNMAMRIAGSGKIIGLTEAQVMSLAAALSSVGIEAEMGGTAISQVMRMIDKEIGTGSQKVKDFALVSGKSTAKFEKDWKENAGLAILSVIEGIAGLVEKGINTNIVLDELGFVGIRMSDALLRASGAGEKFRETMKLGNEAWKENNALTHEANLRYGTAESKLIMAKNRVAQLSASFGDALVPGILAVIKFLEPFVIWLGKLSPRTKTIIVVVGLLVAAIAPLIIVLGALVASFGVLAGITAPVWGVIVAITLAVIALADSARILMKHWKPVAAFFKGIWEKISGVTKYLPTWAKKKLGIEMGEPVSNNSKSLITTTAGTGKSETDINIKLTADEGTSASVEKVKKKKGDASVNVATVGYVGAH